MIVPRTATFKWFALTRGIGRSEGIIKSDLTDEFRALHAPLEANGTVYTTAGSRRALIALNAKTGELKWVYSLDEGARANSPGQLSGRGVSFWTDGKGDESFGTHGMVDRNNGRRQG